MNDRKNQPGRTDKASVSDEAFSHAPPYQERFNERIPLLQAFRMALSIQIAAHRPKPDKRAPNPGQAALNAAECGVYKGYSLLACARIAQEFDADVAFYGLDTFSGLPDLSSADERYAPPTSKYRRMRMFADTSQDRVAAMLAREGVADSVTLVEGRFAETLLKLPERGYFFVNIDCDLYDGHRECLEYFYPRMAPGGMIFFDDYHSVEYPMARAAIDEFLTDKPVQLFHLRYGAAAPNHTKAFVIL